MILEGNMNKVGILTFHYINYYGAVCQDNILKEILNNTNHLVALGERIAET